MTESPNLNYARIYKSDFESRVNKKRSDIDHV